jgi:hypothetical protein
MLRGQLGESTAAQAVIKHLLVETLRLARPVWPKDSSRLHRHALR